MEAAIAVCAILAATMLWAVGVSFGALGALLYCFRAGVAGDAAASAAVAAHGLIGASAAPDGRGRGAIPLTAYANGNRRERSSAY